MVLLTFLTSFFLSIFRDTYKYALLPIFFAILIKAPCKGPLLLKGGDDIYYQNAFITGIGLSDKIFTRFYHHVYLFTHSLDITYFAISIMTVLLCILISYSSRSLLSYPFRFSYLYPSLSILPMILTGAIRQNFGYLLGLFIVSVYISSLYTRPKAFFTFILPFTIIFSFLGHLTTILFVCYILALYHLSFRPTSTIHSLSYKPLLSYFRNLKLPSTWFKPYISKRRFILSLCSFILVTSVLFFVFLSFINPYLFLFLRSISPNIYLDFSDLTTYTGITLIKKYFVVLFLVSLCYLFHNNSSHKYNLYPLLSILDFFMLLSLFIVLLEYVTPTALFPKLMRVSTFLEIATLFISSTIIPRFILLPFTGLLFTSVYFSAVLREDYLVYLRLPLLDALSYCTF